MASVWDLRSLAEIRRRLGLTQAEVAKLSGVSQSLISKIEQGKINPSYEAVKRILQAIELVRAERGRGLTAADICTRKVISIDASDSLGKAIALMKKHGISQLPVLDRGRVVGTISESTIVKKLEKIRSPEIKVRMIMDEVLPTVPETASLSLLRDLFQEYPAVLIQKNGEITGIVTRADLFKVLDSKAARI